MVIELKSSSATAKIDTKGAELISFKDVFSQEYIWGKDARFWARSSPVLFPIVGNLRDGKIHIKGKEYAIEKHGFCRDREFKVMYSSDDKLILNTTYDDETLKIYPFKFSLTLTYSLTDGEISIGYTVLNMGDSDMVYCIGAHPAFNLPIGEGAFEDYRLIFNKEESDGCPIYDCEKLHVNVSKRLDLLSEENGKYVMPLSYSSFDNDAIIFDFLHSDEISLSSIKTGRGVKLALNGFDSIAFWTPLGLKAPFICMEPWNGMAVRSDENDDFETKFSAKTLAPNEQNLCSMTIIPL